MENVAAIVLAAGQSSRMGGAFKPLLSFGQQTVIQACINYLTQGGAESVIVVLGHRAEEVRKTLTRESVSFAINQNPASEMSASIAVGVRELPETTSALLIAPVDYPAVPASVVTSLLDEWSKGFRLVKPTFAGRGGHPVVVDFSLRDELLSLDPALGLKALFAKYEAETKRLEVASPFVARDIDTWDDYLHLYREIFGEAAPEPER